MVNTPGRIMLVDSNQMLLNLHKDFFSRQRINVAGARTSAEALKMLAALRPQVVILSYELSDTSGADCCRTIKQHDVYHAIPTLLLAPENAEAIEDCWQSGCDGVLVRPVQRRELAQVTQSFIELSQRASPRINVQMLVRYGDNGDFEHHDYSVNLSAGGLFLTTSQELTLGQELNLEFLLPSTETPLYCSGRVAWLNRGEHRIRKDLDEGVGIEFTALSDESRRALRQFVMQSLRAGQA